MVSHPKTGSDLPILSDRESGRDTMSGSQCTMCQVQDASNNELKWVHRRHVAPWDWMEIQSRWIKG